MSFIVWLASAERAEQGRLRQGRDAGAVLSWRSRRLREFIVDTQLEQRIRQRAYELWVAADKPEGSHLRFWKEAERQIVSAAGDGARSDPPRTDSDEGP